MDDIKQYIFESLKQVLTCRKIWMCCIATYMSEHSIILEESSLFRIVEMVINREKIDGTTPIRDYFEVFPKDAAQVSEVTKIRLKYDIKQTNQNTILIPKNLIWKAWDMRKDLGFASGNQLVYPFEIDLTGITIGTIITCYTKDTKISPVFLRPVCLTHSNISGKVDISGAIFKEKWEMNILPAKHTNKKRLICQTTVSAHTSAFLAKHTQFTSEAVFSGRSFEFADFGSAHFYGKTYFMYCEFRPLPQAGSDTQRSTCFDYCTFEQKVDFSSSTFTSPLSLRGVKSIGRCVLDLIKLPEKEWTLDMRDFVSQSEIRLSLYDAQNYQNLTLGVYGSTLPEARLMCNQYQFGNIRLMSEQYVNTSEGKTNPYLHPDIRTSEKPRKMNEIKMEEMRIMRTFFQNLNLKDADDQMYYRQMEAQSKDLWFNSSQRGTQSWFRRYVYEWLICKNVFGWGVRLQNVVISSLAVIIGSMFVFRVVFPSSYAGVFNEQGLEQRFEDLSLLELLEFSARNFFNVSSPSQIQSNFGWNPATFSVVEAILGVIFVTVSVAMFSRKFMRF
jgi:hypothetical protein